MDPNGSKKRLKRAKVGAKMLIRKNISLDDKYLKKLQPLLDMKDGNLSAAIRDTITLADTALKYHDSVEEAVRYLKASKNPQEQKNISPNEENKVINRTTLEWLFRHTRGRLADEELVNELINPFEIEDLKGLEAYLNRTSEKNKWDVRVSISCKESQNPASVQILFSNATPNSREFFTQLVALFLAKWKRLDVDHVFRRANSTQVSFKKNLSASPQEIMPGIRKHFGYLDIVCREIDDNPEFWTQLMYTYNVERSNLVTLHRSQFETFAAGKAPNPTKIVERLGKQAVSEMELADLLILFKRMYLVTQLVKNIELSLEPGKESATIFHDFRNEKVISNLVAYFSQIFIENRVEFMVSSSTSMIVFKFNEKAKDKSMEYSEFSEPENPKLQGSS